MFVRRKAQTHQDPVPDRAGVDAIALCPDGNGQRPRKEDDKRLDEMEDILGASQVSTRRAREPQWHLGGGSEDDCKGGFNPSGLHPTGDGECEGVSGGYEMAGERKMRQGPQEQRKNAQEGDRSRSGNGRGRFWGRAVHGLFLGFDISLVRAAPNNNW